MKRVYYAIKFSDIVFVCKYKMRSHSQQSCICKKDDKKRILCNTKNCPLLKFRIYDFKIREKKDE